MTHKATIIVEAEDEQTLNHLLSWFDSAEAADAAANVLDNYDTAEWHWQLLLKPQTEKDMTRYRMILTDEQQNSEVARASFDAEQAHGVGVDMADAVAEHEDREYGLVGGTFSFNVTAVEVREQNGLWQAMAKLLEDAGVGVEDGGFQED